MTTEDDRTSAAKVGLLTQAYHERLPMRERVIEAIINQCYDAFTRGECELVATLQREGWEQIHKLEQELADSDAHRPRWVQAKVAQLRASLLDAAGEYEEAVTYDERALEYADNPRQKVVGLVNMGCAFRQLGQHDVSLGFFEQALELKTDSGGVIVHWFAGMLAVGRVEEAFDELLDPRTTERMTGREWPVFETHLKNDEWLASVRDDPRWSRVRKSLGELAEARRK